MSCDHKFKNDLNLGRIDFEPTTLIVGSFYPEWPENNSDDWFYGRTKDADGQRINYFWDVLPRIYGEHSLIDAGPQEWKQFCSRKQIALTDLISSIDDADPHTPGHVKILGGYSDKAMVYNFDDFTYVGIVQILRLHPGIKHVYLTRGVTEAFWRYLWNPVMHYCNVNSIRERILLTPSDQSLYHHEAHNKDNPNDIVSSQEDYILKRWQQEWHF